MRHHVRPRRPHGRLHARALLAALLPAATALALAGCGGSDAAKPSASEVVVATTKELRDTGILDTLQSGFRSGSSCTVAARIGTAAGGLELGKDGAANLLLVDAPAAEKRFMADGHGSSRVPVMHRDYVIVGPPDDPAGALQAADAVAALKAIAAAKQPFVSRGDESPTNVRERALWKEAGITPRVPWYAESHKGTKETLTEAGQKLAYSLVDRSGYLASKGVPLRVITEGGSQLADPYHAIVTKGGGRCAQEFSDYLQKPGTQAIIGSFGVGQFGSPVWFADGSQG